MAIATAVAELLEDGQGSAVSVQRLLVVTALLGDDAELTVGVGHATAVAELLEDGQSLAVSVQRLLVIAPLLGDYAEVVVGAGHATAVAELLEDGQGSAVPVQRLLIIAPLVGDDAKLVGEGRGIARAVRNELQGLPAELLFPRPGPPGVQLRADRPGDADSLVKVVGGQVVVAGLQQVGDVGLPVLGPDLDTPAQIAGRAPVCRRKLGQAYRPG
jgi:hypothetical protein